MQTGKDVAKIDEKLKEQAAQLSKNHLKTYRVVTVPKTNFEKQKISKCFLWAYYYKMS